MLCLYLTHSPLCVALYSGAPCLENIEVINGITSFTNNRLTPHRQARL